MDTTINQQVAMDEALVPHARRLRIERATFAFYRTSNLRNLLFNLCMMSCEFWAAATVHHHSIRFKMDNKKHIVNLESFREMLHICPRLSNQPFVETPFEKEILAFLRFLGHNGAIRRLTDVEHKDTNKSNEMYYPRFTKVIIHHFMSNDPSIPRRNKVNWHYVRDDHIFTTIKLVSRHQNTQHFGATPPKPKASIRKTRSNSDTTITPPTAAAGPRLATSEKGKQAAKASKAKSVSALSEVAMTEAQQLKLATKRSLQQAHVSQASGSGADEGTGIIPGVPDVPTDESEEEISWNSTDEEGDDDDDDEDDQEEGGDDEQASDEEEFIHPSLSTHAEEETRDEESFDPIPKTPKNTDDEGNGEENLGTNVGREEGHDEEEDELYRDVNINIRRGIQTTQEFEDSHVTLPPVNLDGQQQSSSVSSQIVTSILNPTPDAGMESIFETTSQMDVQTPTLVAHLPMSAPTVTPSTIATITSTQQAPTPPTTAPSTLIQNLPDFSLIQRAVQIQSDRLRDEAQAENDEFLKTIDENMQKIIKEQVKEQVKVQVSKILPKIEHTVNEQLEAKVLTRSSNSLKTSYVVVVDLSEMEFKKILIEKMEGNKSIHRSNEQRNLYKALVKAYESDKIILDTYGDTVTLKRRRDDDADKDKEPFAGSDRGSKRQEPMQTTFEMEEPSHPEFETSVDDQPIVEPSQHPEWFSQQKKPSTPDRQQYPHNLLKPLPLIPNNRGRRVIPFDHFINNDLEYLRGGASSRKYTTSVTKTKAANYGHIKWIEDLFYGFAVKWESARDVYSKRRIITVTELKIVEWNNYKHLDWIMVRRDDDKIYKFKEGDFKRLRIQDIEDMLLLLVQGKLTNLTAEESFAFNVSLQMFTRSIVIQRHMEDLQLGVVSYQKKLNITKPDTYHSDLKRKKAYIADGTLTDVRTALDDRLKGIRIKYLPQSIWRKSDKDRAVAMIQAIDNRLKTRRIMRSLERFVGGRLYEGDFRMLQRTI
nr:hypothetical protein [Tanacetum cinerariifolium]